MSGRNREKERECKNALERVCCDDESIGFGVVL
jgi:hypothetical protein